MIFEEEPLHLIGLNAAVRVVLAIMQVANPLLPRTRHSDLLKHGDLGVACNNLFRYEFGDVVVLHLRQVKSLRLDLQGELLQAVDEGLLRIFFPPRRRDDELGWVGWILVHQNFVKLAEPIVSFPRVILCKTEAATKMVQWSVVILALIPDMVARNKAASPTQKQFLVLAVWSQI